MNHQIEASQRLTSLAALIVAAALATCGCAELVADDPPPAAHAAPLPPANNVALPAPAVHAAPAALAGNVALAAPASRVVAAAPAASVPPAAPAAGPATVPASEQVVVDPTWAAISEAIERPGVLKDEVYTIAVPRDDLEVSIEGQTIPTAAGIESVFHFYGCPCGRMNVAGQFVAADYEVDDVVDALRQNATMRVSAIAPMFLFGKPQLMLIRFQGEGDAAAMAKVIREAMRWTGKERMEPQQVNDPKPADAGAKPIKP